ncbi:MAG TPA: class I SAM-dependent methyltransferase [Longimicrobiales bacterium]
MRWVGRNVYRTLRKLGFVTALNMWRFVTRPMPLNDFADYDAYWIERRRAGYDPVMNRFVIGAKYIPSGASVVDVGCGTGMFLKYALERDPSLTVFGIDLSGEAVEITRSKGIPAARMDLLAGERPDERFDVVTAFEVIEHIGDAEAFLAALGSICKPDGLILISIPNTGFVLHRIRLAVLGRFPVTNIMLHMKEHLRFWTVRDFRDWARHYGYDVLRVEAQRTPVSPRLLGRFFPGLWANQIVCVLRRRGAAVAGG